MLVRAFVPVGKLLLISGDFRSVGNVERGKKVPEAFTTRNKDSFYIQTNSLQKNFHKNKKTPLT